MNKTQYLALGGVLLASTALSSIAGAGTIGIYNKDTNNFTTTPVRIANSLFSTTASTANSIIIEAANTVQFGMRYSNRFSGSTRFTTEFTVTGAQFITAGLSASSVKLMTSSLGDSNSVIASLANTNTCTTVTNLVNLFVARDCSLTTAVTGAVVGIALTGVTFNNASGLATAGSTVTLSGRVLDPNDSTSVFEATSSGTILTSTVAAVVTVTAGTTGTASATTTPTAFTSLSAPSDGSLSLILATISLSSAGAVSNDLTTPVGATTAGTTSIAIASSLLSGGAARSVTFSTSGAVTTLSYLTSANFSSGTVTFSLADTTWTPGASATVSVQFLGTTAIPAAVAGTVTGTVDVGLQSYAAAGTTAALGQGGFRAEVNTFNASTNGPFSSYLRIHNNGAVAGVVTITISNDDHASGAQLGSSFTTGSIVPASTMQLSAAEMEGTTTSTKLPSGGANVPTESRQGSYTVTITGPIVGYVQHILFDGNSVADLSGYRNSGATVNNP